MVQALDHSNSFIYLRHHLDERYHMAEVNTWWPSDDINLGQYWPLHWPPTKGLLAGRHQAITWIKGAAFTRVQFHKKFSDPYHSPLFFLRSVTFTVSNTELTWKHLFSCTPYWLEIHSRWIDKILHKRRIRVMHTTNLHVLEYQVVLYTQRLYLVCTYIGRMARKRHW